MDNKNKEERGHKKAFLIENGKGMREQGYLEKRERWGEITADGAQSRAQSIQTGSSELRL